MYISQLLNTLLYYLSLPLIYFISLLPFRILYLFADGIYLLLYYVIGYRKKVVFTNLRNAFPEKTIPEIRQIQRKFYRYFCDLILETLKTLTISPGNLKSRVRFENTEILRGYFENNESVLLFSGHMGNWELVGSRYSLESLHQLYVIYHPLKNKRFDKLLYHMRTRLGTKLYARNTAFREIIRNRNLLTATGFITDQTPPPESAYWTTFLNQDTPIFNGTEKIAKKLNLPVIFISIKRPQRGYYTMKAEMLLENPKDTELGEISELHTKRLERDIIEQPEIWLWTHRRWKHKRTKKPAS